MSSYYTLANSYIVYDRTYWRGDHETYIAISPWGSINALGYMNNKTSSYWAF